MEESGELFLYTLKNCIYLYFKNLWMYHWSKNMFKSLNNHYIVQHLTLIKFLIIGCSINTNYVFHACADGKLKSFVYFRHYAWYLLIDWHVNMSNILNYEIQLSFQSSLNNYIFIQLLTIKQYTNYSISHRFRQEFANRNLFNIFKYKSILKYITVR